MIIDIVSFEKGKKKYDMINLVLENDDLVDDTKESLHDIAKTVIAYYQNKEEEYRKNELSEYEIRGLGDWEKGSWETELAYGGLRLLIIGIFKYAKKRKYTQISITQFMGDLDLPKKCFSKRIVKDEESVFTDIEVEKISDYIRENTSLINYGILLAFQTGVRVGELCTLKYSDIKVNKLCIRRTEVRYRGEDGRYVFEVRESPKTEAGNRDIILNSDAQRTLKEIRRLNPFGEYMFMSDGKRIKEKAFSVKIVKICRYVGIKERSMHKARKTYATKLINGGVDESLVVRQMGHTSIDCTKNHYYFNNKSDEDAAKQIEKAISY